MNAPKKPAYRPAGKGPSGQRRPGETIQQQIERVVKAKLSGANPSPAKSSVPKEPAGPPPNWRRPPTPPQRPTRSPPTPPPMRPSRNPDLVDEPAIPVATMPRPPRFQRLLRQQPETSTFSAGSAADSSIPTSTMTNPMTPPTSTLTGDSSSDTSGEHPLTGTSIQGSRLERVVVCSRGTKVQDGRFTPGAPESRKSGWDTIVKSLHHISEKDRDRSLQKHIGVNGLILQQNLRQPAFVKAVAEAVAQTLRSKSAVLIFECVQGRHCSVSAAMTATEALKMLIGTEAVRTRHLSSFNWEGTCAGECAACKAGPEPDFQNSVLAVVDAVRELMRDYTVHDDCSACGDRSLSGGSNRYNELSCTSLPRIWDEVVLEFSGGFSCLKRSVVGECKQLAQIRRADDCSARTTLVNPTHAKYNTCLCDKPDEHKAANCNIHPRNDGDADHDQPYTVYPARRWLMPALVINWVANFGSLLWYWDVCRKLLCVKQQTSAKSVTCHPQANNYNNKQKQKCTESENKPNHPRHDDRERPVASAFEIDVTAEPELCLCHTKIQKVGIHQQLQHESCDYSNKQKQKYTAAENKHNHPFIRIGIRRRTSLDSQVLLIGGCTGVRSYKSIDSQVLFIEGCAQATIPYSPPRRALKQSNHPRHDDREQPVASASALDVTAALGSSLCHTKNQTTNTQQQLRIESYDKQKYVSQKLHKQADKHAGLMWRCRWFIWLRVPMVLLVVGTLFLELQVFSGGMLHSHNLDCPSSDVAVNCRHLQPDVPSLEMQARNILIGDCVTIDNIRTLLDHPDVPWQQNGDGHQITLGAARLSLTRATLALPNFTKAILQYFRQCNSKAYGSTIVINKNLQTTLHTDARNEKLPAFLTAITQFGEGEIFLKTAAGDVFFDGHRGFKASIPIHGTLEVPTFKIPHATCDWQGTRIIAVMFTTTIKRIDACKNNLRLQLQQLGFHVPEQAQHWVDSELTGMRFGRPVYCKPSSIRGLLMNAGDRDHCSIDDASSVRVVDSESEVWQIPSNCSKHDEGVLETTHTWPDIFGSDISDIECCSDEVADTEIDTSTESELHLSKSSSKADIENGGHGVVLSRKRKYQSPARISDDEVDGYGLRHLGFSSNTVGNRFGSSCSSDCELRKLQLLHAPG